MNYVLNVVNYKLFLKLNHCYLETLSLVYPQKERFLQNVIYDY